MAAEIHKLQKNGVTIYPATVTDAVVREKDKKSLTKILNEISSFKPWFTADSDLSTFSAPNGIVYLGALIDLSNDNKTYNLYIIRKGSDSLPPVIQIKDSEGSIYSYSGNIGDSGIYDITLKKGNEAYFRAIVNVDEFTTGTSWEEKIHINKLFMWPASDKGITDYINTVSMPYFISDKSNFANYPTGAILKIGALKDLDKGKSYILKYLNIGSGSICNLVRIDDENGSVVGQYYTDSVRNDIGIVDIGDSFRVLCDFSKFNDKSTTLNVHVNPYIMWSASDYEVKQEISRINEDLDSINSKINDTIIPGELSAHNATACSGTIVVDFPQKQTFTLSIDDTDNTLKGQKVGIYYYETKGGEIKSLGKEITVGTSMEVTVPTKAYSIYLFKTGVSDLNIGDKTSVTILVKPQIQEDINNYVKQTISDMGIDKPLNGITIVCFGDSITEFKDDDDKGWCDYMSDILAANIINLGIGGTMLKPRLEYSPTIDSDSQAYARMDIPNCIKAVIHKEGSDEFIRFEEGVKYMEDKGDNNRPILERAKTTDLSNVDIVIIFGGTNDWGGHTSAECITSMEEVIKEMLQLYPHLKLFYFTPIPRFPDKTEIPSNEKPGSMKVDFSEEHYSDNLEKNGETLKTFAENMMNLGLKFKFPCFDAYNNTNITPYNWSAYFPDWDGTHPRKGFKHLARKFAGFLISCYYV